MEDSSNNNNNKDYNNDIISDTKKKDVLDNQKPITFYSENKFDIKSYGVQSIMYTDICFFNTTQHKYVFNTFSNKLIKRNLTNNSKQELKLGDNILSCLCENYSYIAVANYFGSIFLVNKETFIQEATIHIDCCNYVNHISISEDNAYIAFHCNDYENIIDNGILCLISINKNNNSITEKNEDCNKQEENSIIELKLISILIGSYVFPKFINKSLSNNNNIQLIKVLKENQNFKHEIIIVEIEKTINSNINSEFIVRQNTLLEVNKEENKLEVSFIRYYNNLMFILYSKKEFEIYCFNDEYSEVKLYKEFLFNIKGSTRSFTIYNQYILMCFDSEILFFIEYKKENEQINLFDINANTDGKEEERNKVIISNLDIENKVFIDNLVSICCTFIIENTTCLDDTIRLWFINERGIFAYEINLLDILKENKQQKRNSKEIIQFTNDLLEVKNSLNHLDTNNIDGSKEATSITPNDNNYNPVKLIFKEEPFLKLTGCGLSFNSENTYLAIGDLASNLVIFSVEEEKVFKITKLEYSIRSLVFANYINFQDPLYLEKEQYGIVYIGLMAGGGLYSYDCVEDNLKLEVRLKGTITCLKVFSKDKYFLIAGTTKGNVNLFEIDESQELILIFSFYTHEPNLFCNMNRFGSLPFYSEIWNITVNPFSKILDVLEESLVDNVMKENITNTIDGFKAKVNRDFSHLSIHDFSIAKESCSLDNLNNTNKKDNVVETNSINKKTTIKTECDLKITCNNDICKDSYVKQVLTKRKLKKSIISNNNSYTEFFFATVSEDQSVKVFSYETNNNPHLLFHDHRHLLASTCVSWKNMKILNKNTNKIVDIELLSSCSDDRTINVYLLKNRNLELLDLLDNIKSNNTQDVTALNPFIYLCSLNTWDYINRWHTITYSDMEEDGNKIACVTQNGYLVVWEVELRSESEEKNEKFYFKSKQENNQMHYPLNKNFNEKPLLFKSTDALDKIGNEQSSQLYFHFDVIYFGKVNFGGIEGLHWNKNKLAFVGSDLSVNIITFK